jgi:hypothetical protein
MQHARPNRLRRAVIYAALATMLGVVSLTLSQCTMVNDLTGVDMFRSHQADCVHACKALAKLAEDQEDKFHTQTLLLCNQPVCEDLPPEDQPACIAARTACIDAENARHAEAKHIGKETENNCKRTSCHHQGTGTAG